MKKLILFILLMFTGCTTIYEDGKGEQFCYDNNSSLYYLYYNYEENEYTIKCYDGYIKILSKKEFNKVKGKKAKDYIEKKK